MPMDAALPVARAFAQFLHLANIAEQHHRIRRRRMHQRDPDARPQARSIEETLPRLAAEVGPDRLHAAILALRIELVLTAHPTEIMRRTLQRKYTAIAQALAGLDRPDVTPLEREALGRRRCAARSPPRGRPRRCAASARRRSTRCAPPSASSSTPSGTPFPSTCGRWTGRCAAVIGRELPLEAAPIRFGSWIGGDRDGNPAITPEVTRRACLGARWVALTLYARDVAALREDLSMTDASDGAPRLHGRRRRAVPRAAAQRPSRHRVDAARHPGPAVDAPRRPRRRHGGRGGVSHRGRTSSGRCALCFDSLHATGNGVIADGPLTDVLRRLACFGLALARLDIRQEARRHADAIDLIARHAGRPGYADWPEDARVAFLRRQLDAVTRTRCRPRRRPPVQPAHRRSAADVPDDRHDRAGLAGRVRDHDGRPALRRPGGGAAAAARRRRSAAPRRAALRNGAGPARVRRRGRPAVVDPVVSRPRGARPAIARK